MVYSSIAIMLYCSNFNHLSSIFKQKQKEINTIWFQTSLLLEKIPFTLHYFFLCLAEFKEFRSIVYYRLGHCRFLTSWLLQGRESLYICTKDIGEGLTIQHGFSTIINAKRIGKNCRVFQQVTIGFNGTQSPIIGDNVEICCGAKVIGGIHVGNNVIIGANAVVCKDVPDNVIVAGVPSKIIKYL